mmetsp:Transcript_998/g.2427  ORF Transcript_998/g.2427 Transcript_998/m.2427 type:complete len:426 (+) Transcript_998:313-1590(+)
MCVAGATHPLSKPTAGLGARRRHALGARTHGWCAAGERTSGRRTHSAGAKTTTHLLPGCEASLPRHAVLSLAAAIRRRFARGRHCGRCNLLGNRHLLGDSLEAVVGKGLALARLEALLALFVGPVALALQAFTLSIHDGHLLLAREEAALSTGKPLLHRLLGPLSLHVGVFEIGETHLKCEATRLGLGRIFLRPLLHRLSCHSPLLRRAQSTCGREDVGLAGPGSACSGAGIALVTLPLHLCALLFKASLRLLALPPHLSTLLFEASLGLITLPPHLHKLLFEASLDLVALPLHFRNLLFQQSLGFVALLLHLRTLLLEACLGLGSDALALAQGALRLEGELGVGGEACALLLQTCLSLLRLIQALSKVPFPHCQRGLDLGRSLTLSRLLVAMQVLALLLQAPKGSLLRLFLRRPGLLAGGHSLP